MGHALVVEELLLLEEIVAAARRSPEVIDLTELDRVLGLDRLTVVPAAEA